MRSLPLTAFAIILTTVLGGGGAISQSTAQDEKILERGDKLLEEAKVSYEEARKNASVQAFVEAGFKLEEARIKFIVVQEIGTPDKQKLATDRLRAINQLSKLIHDGKTAISGAPANTPAPVTPDAPAVPAPVSQPPKPIEPPAKAALDVSKRIPIPDASKQRDAEKLIRDLFKDQYAKKAPADRKALAQVLLKEAAKSQDDPASLWVLYREAQDVAVQSCDARAAVEAIESAAQYFDIDPLALKNAALTGAVKVGKSPEEFLVLSHALLKLIGELVSADQFDQADKAASLAQQCAKKSNDTGVLGRATTVSKEVVEAKALYQAMKRVLETQAKNPDDPAANLEIGQFLCFVKGSWDLGLRFIAKGSDATLKSLADKELSFPATAAEQVSLADGWFDLSEKEKSPLRKSQLLSHSRSLYEQALLSAAGIIRTKIEKRLESMGQPATVQGAVVDLIRLIDVKREGVTGDWTCDGRSLICNRIVKGGRVPIPYEPPEEYELTLVVERTEGAAGLYIGLAKGNTQFYASIDDWAGTLTGIGYLDGKNPKDNETAVKGVLLTNGKPSTIVCGVRKNEISVTVDGKKIVSFKPGYERLSNVEFPIPNRRALFVGCGNTRYTISKMTLTGISGQGKISK